MSESPVTKPLLEEEEYMLVNEYDIPLNLLDSKELFVPVNELCLRHGIYGTSDDIFDKIYKLNYLKESDNNNEFVKPNLLKGIPPISFCTEKSINYHYNPEDFIEENITHMGGIPGIIIEEVSNALKNKELSQDLKYLTISNIINKYKSKYEDSWKELFKQFIIRYAVMLLYNKCRLLNRLKIRIKECIANIGECDTGFDAFRNKKIEHNIKSTFKDSLYSGINAKIGTLQRYVMGEDTYYVKCKWFIEHVIKDTATQQLEMQKFNIMEANVKEKAKKSLGTITQFGNRTEFEEYLKDLENRYQELALGKAEENIDYLRDISDSVRSDILSMHNAFINDYCTRSEVLQTLHEYKNDYFWIYEAGLIGSVNCAAQAAQYGFIRSQGTTDYHDISARILANVNNDTTFGTAISEIASATVTTLLSPILMSIVNVGVRAVLDSEFWKNMEKRKIFNDYFQTTISEISSKHYIKYGLTFKQELNKKPCSQELSSYRNIFNETREIINNLDNLGNKYYNIPLENFKFYLFVAGQIFYGHIIESEAETEQRKQVQLAKKEEKARIEAEKKQRKAEEKKQQKAEEETRIKDEIENHKQVRLGTDINDRIEEFLSESDILTPVKLNDNAIVSVNGNNYHFNNGTDIRNLVRNLITYTYTSDMLKDIQDIDEFKRTIRGNSEIIVPTTINVQEFINDIIKIFKTEVGGSSVFNTYQDIHYDSKKSLDEQTLKELKKSEFSKYGGNNRTYKTRTHKKSHKKHYKKILKNKSTYKVRGRNLRKTKWMH
jgi:hypothetical protein